MTRKEVYAVIDGERAHQDERWGGPQHDLTHSATEFLGYIQGYVEESMWWHYRGHGSDLETMETIRKVAALAVAAMEVHGAPERAR